MEEIEPLPFIPETYRSFKTETIELQVPNQTFKVKNHTPKFDNFNQDIFEYEKKFRGIVMQLNWTEETACFMLQTCVNPEIFRKLKHSDSMNVIFLELKKI
ncbi:hypothetical protein M153_3810003389 [Pseudoloma neurophilia]|uniref:Uncharacterized protein n=1 Tax=Pseudoloma neurophilia TaxID=146866 RepID=A0A0R0M6S9_9MICR|nr:hypothetical protein M153_3810003389 [Pseudoloma neurophilia]